MMSGRNRIWFLAAAAGFLFACVVLNLSFGSKNIPMADVIQALFAFDEKNYDHFIILFQRSPRALIACYVGASMAICGAVLQGLTRNPLASPSLLGVNSGATLFVIAIGIYMSVPEAWHGLLAFAGGLFGYFSCLTLARIAGIANDPRNLSLILAGAVISILYGAIANALVLADPGLRFDMLGWVTGNINHAYVERLQQIWPIGAVGALTVFALGAPLTLIMLGQEKAQSTGVNVALVSNIAIFASVGAAAAAVSICGPIGFVGLVVPHIVRPFAGAHFSLSLPANAMMGAAFVLIADLIARIAFAPFVLHTAVVLELVGGLVFIFIVKRFYTSHGVGA